jgi:hypothetical protein
MDIEEAMIDIFWNFLFIWHGFNPNRNYHLYLIRFYDGKVDCGVAIPQHKGSDIILLLKYDITG